MERRSIIDDEARFWAILNQPVDHVLQMMPGQSLLRQEIGNLIMALSFQMLSQIRARIIDGGTDQVLHIVAFRHHTSHLSHAVPIVYRAPGKEKRPDYA